MSMYKALIMVNNHKKTSMDQYLLVAITLYGDYCLQVMVNAICKTPIQWYSWDMK